MSEVLVNSNVYSKTVLRKKPHRTVAKGLKLFNEMFKTVTKPNTNFINYPLLDQKNDLPHDLFTYEILARLPIKCLLQLKSVSKDWHSTVSSYEFASAHFKTRLSGYHPCSSVEGLVIQVASKFYLFYIQDEAVALDYCLVKLEPNFDDLDENNVQLVGSCNGLVCLADSSSSSDYFYIWNPVTYHSRKISDPCFISDHCIVSWGFAYVSSVDDYKVVRIVQDYDTLETVVLVFSLGSREWKRVHDHGLDQCLFLTKINPGVLVDDSLYWIMVSRGVLEKRVVVRFNLSLEKFEEVPGLVPKDVNPRDQFLCVTGGCLSLYNSNVRHEADLSILKRPEETESISISSRLDKWDCFGLVGFTKTGKCFVISKGSELALMDLESPRKQHIPLVTFEQVRRPSIVSYVPSLISPFPLGDLQKD
ncbi:hypothetical protein RND81_05G098700 [Saponaria officinalis]|uniref:F-box domain-containing protein n=1 Tax=Saponaria officinalis TaxID=3572 RepID=A0AAW1KZK3_SAPOF